MSEAIEWRCFFCDEVFTERREAWLHFGEESCDSDVPACVDPLRTDEKKRMAAVRKARKYGDDCRRDADTNQDAVDNLEAMYEEIRRYFGEDCNSVWLAGDRYKSALNRMSDLEKLAAAESK